MTPNPYVHTFSTTPAEIAPIGRERVINQLVMGAMQTTPQSFQINSFRGMGVTTLLKHLVSGWDNLSSQMSTSSHLHILPIYIDCLFFIDGDALEWLVEQLFANEKLQSYWAKGEDLEDSPSYKLRHLVQKAQKENIRLIFLLDHFDNAFKHVSPDKAVLLRPLVMLASFIIGSEQPLVDINAQAASSWFGNTMFTIHLPPLLEEEAKRLLAKAGKDDSLTTMDDRKGLLHLTGYHPSFILRGAAELYELRQTHSAESRPYKNNLDRILEDRLKHRVFLSDFDHYWRHMSNMSEKPGLYQGCLIRLVTNQQLRDDTTLLDHLRERGLVILDNNHYQPFSHLWRQFIRSKYEPTVDDLEFTAREQSLLHYLRNNVGRVCTYEEILTHVWRSGNTEKNLHTLREVVRRVRSKLSKQGQDVRIVNRRNQGYEYQVDK